MVAHYGDALAGKILVDITNPFNADASGLVTTQATRLSEQIAAAAPEGAHVVKAFNTIFGGVLAKDTPLDAFFAGDSAEAKARCRGVPGEPGACGPSTQEGCRWPTILEWAGLLLVGLARNGAGFDLALGAEVR